MADRRPPVGSPVDRDEVDPDRQPRQGRAVRERRRRPAARPIARRRAARLRWSSDSSASPKSRRPRQRTSTTTSVLGGPGSIPTRSSSSRPTRTFRARTSQPPATSRSATSGLRGVAQLRGAGPAGVGHGPNRWQAPLTRDLSTAEPGELGRPDDRADRLVVLVGLDVAHRDRDHRPGVRELERGEVVVAGELVAGPPRRRRTAPAGRRPAAPGAPASTCGGAA